MTLGMWWPQPDQVVLSAGRGGLALGLGLGGERGEGRLERVEREEGIDPREEGGGG